MEYLRDILLLIGAALLLFGCWQVFPPSSWIIGGVGVIYVAVRWSRAAALKGKRDGTH